MSFPPVVPPIADEYLGEIEAFDPHATVQRADFESDEAYQAALARAGREVDINSEDWTTFGESSEEIPEIEIVEAPVIVDATEISSEHGGANPLRPDVDITDYDHIEDVFTEADDSSSESSFDGSEDWDAWSSDEFDEFDADEYETPKHPIKDTGTVAAVVTPINTGATVPDSKPAPVQIPAQTPVDTKPAPAPEKPTKGGESGGGSTGIVFIALAALAHLLRRREDRKA